MANPRVRNLRLDGKRRLKRWALGCYRLGVILIALLCLRAIPRDQSGPDRAQILAKAKQAIPNVVSVADPVDGLFPLQGVAGDIVGWATSTLPHAKNIHGYSGPSELLVIFGVDRRVKQVVLMSSSDTEGHLEKICKDQGFWAQWRDVPEASLGVIGSPVVVSGATLTSEAMVRGMAARFGAEGMDQWFPDALRLDEIKTWFPEADQIEVAETAGIYRVVQGEDLLGHVLRSSRMGVSARGFNGISDVIVCLDREGKNLLGIGFLGSRDNEPYVSDVRDEVKYNDGFAGKSVDEILSHQDEASPFLFTSGASYTNHAVVESVREMLRRYRGAEKLTGFPWKHSLALGWIGLGLFFGLNKTGGKPWIRTGFAVISVAAGIWLGWMVSQDQLLGWGMNGFGFRGILPLIVLTAVALVVPVFTGKNVYCSRICPHGAAQTLMGKIVKKRFHLPAKLHHVLVRLPWLTLIVIWVLAFLGSGWPLAYFEPFETWSSGFIAFVPAAILSIGLIAAIFLPQGYCHYGCPTGALLKFLTHSPGTWTRRDSIAAGLLVVAAAYVVL